MKHLIGALVLGLALAATAATSKTWPENYWTLIETTEAAQRPTPAPVALAFTAADAEVVWQDRTMSSFDTFLFGHYPSSNSILGLSTLSIGMMLMLK